MRIAQIRRDEDDWGRLHNYNITATHPFSLPGFRCPTCGNVWSTTGAAYPAVDLSAEPWAKRMVSDVVSLEEFQELRGLVLPFLPPGADPQPGWQFGRLSGRASGSIGDFAWVTSWTMLVRHSVLEALVALGVRMPVHVRPDLRWRSANAPDDVVELQVEPLAELSPGSYEMQGTPCPICGRVRRKFLGLIVESWSVPEDVDVFRPKYYTGFILASERFVEAVRELNLTDIAFEYVDVV